MNQLPKFTYHDIMETEPCFDPATGTTIFEYAWRDAREIHPQKFCDTEWEGTLLDCRHAGVHAVDLIHLATAIDEAIPKDVKVNWMRLLLQEYTSKIAERCLQKYLELGDDDFFWSAYSRILPGVNCDTSDPVERLRDWIEFSMHSCDLLFDAITNWMEE